MAQLGTYTYRYPRPMVTADCVIFSADGNLLLVQRGGEPYKGHWALPGGFMEMDESLEACAARELQEETGISVSPHTLRQVGTYSALDRDPRGRTITTAYTATLPTATPPTAADDAAAARWWPLSALPPLAFDHAQIVADAQRQAAEAAASRKI